MQLGMIGLGRMGGNIVRRLTRNGHQCVVFDQNPAAIKALVGERRQRRRRPQATGRASSTSRAPSGSCCRRARSPRTRSTQLGALLEAGDIIIDGGNSFYKDDIRRAKALKAKGIHYVDCGTSGGVWGLERGYCMMIGGDKEAVDRLDPIFGRWRPAPATSRSRPTARAAIRASSAATCIAARAAPGVSSR